MSTNALLISLIPILISLAMLVGGFFAFKNGYRKQIGEIESNVINALKTLNEAQERQISSLEDEITRMKRVLNTIQIALQRRGLTIEIDRDAITLIDVGSKSERVVQISMTDKLPAIDKDSSEK